MRMDLGPKADIVACQLRRLFCSKADIEQFFDVPDLDTEHKSAALFGLLDGLLEVAAPFWSVSFRYLRGTVDLAGISCAIHQFVAWSWVLQLLPLERG